MWIIFRKIAEDNKEYYIGCGQWVYNRKLARKFSDLSFAEETAEYTGGQVERF